MRSQLLVSALLAGLASAQRSCNGSPSLCGRQYSNVTLVGAHDSPFVGFLPSDNQYIGVADQLRMGVRFLQGQTHSKGGAIQLCHTSCDLRDAGTLAAYLGPVKTFLDGNAGEVVTLLLTNGDNIPISKFGDAFKSAGLDGYAFAPSGKLEMGAWPTLGSLIDQKKRLIVFMDFHADTSKVPYILDEFAYYFESPYDETNSAFPNCKLDRPQGGNPDGRMYIVNHMLHVGFDLFDQEIQVPDWLNSPRTNSVSSITAQASLCYSMYKRMPNVVLLDFVNIGDAIGAQRRMNNI